MNLIEKGANYGWPVISHRREAEGMRTPLIEITPAAGPGKLLFYQGTAFPELRGSLLLCCLRGSAVFRISLGGDGLPTHIERLWHQKWGRIRFINGAPDGSLWLGTSMQDPPEGKPQEGDDKLIRIVADPAGTVDAVAGQAAAPVRLTPQTKDPADLERIIRDGVPEAGMPPASGLLTEAQISQVADYLRAKRR